ncbi:MAG TPA: two-component system response regulator [Victivallales bacterium]|nr:two-component system response regulator [Victivallales bacterium]
MPDISNCIVLIVDDTETNIDILVDTLEDSYELRVAMDGETALKDVKEYPPDIILLDIMMPGMDGYEVCAKLKSDGETSNIPIVFLTAMSEENDEEKGLELGAIDYITKPFSPKLVKSRVKNHLELKMYQDKLEELVKERTKELRQTQEVVIESMANLAEYRDPETGGHIQRTKNYVKLLAEKLKNHPKFAEYLDEKSIELLYQSAPLHDIGKIAIPDEVLLKPGKLTDEEFDLMKRHTVYGKNAIQTSEKKLGKNSFLIYAREMAETHQEKWDGSGYPCGLKRNEIPISGRLMALADVYDALISKRVYKPSFSHKKAVDIIKESKDKHFDPDIVDAFLEIENEFRKIAYEFADCEEEKNNLLEPI